MVEECKDAEWQAKHFPVEVGCRGYIGGRLRIRREFHWSWAGKSKINFKWISKLRKLAIGCGPKEMKVCKKIDPPPKRIQSSRHVVNQLSQMMCIHISEFGSRKIQQEPCPKMDNITFWGHWEPPGIRYKEHLTGSICSYKLHWTSWKRTDFFCKSSDMKSQ